MKFAVVCLVICIAFVSSARINLRMEIDENDLVENYEDFASQSEKIGRLITACNPAACNKSCLQEKVRGICVDNKCFCLDKKDFIFE